MNQHQITALRLSLQMIPEDKLSVLAAVSGVDEVRIQEIIDGDDPTTMEFSVFDMLRRA